MIYVQIFGVFFYFGLISFGGVYGVLPQLEGSLVGQHHWVTHEQFISAFVVGQLVPGPNMAMAPMVGYQIARFPGWAAAFAGIYSVPLLITGLAYAIYGGLRHIDWVRRLEISLRPLVFGLILASATQLFWSQARGHALLAIAVTALGGVLYAHGRIGTLTTLFLLAGLWWVGIRLQ